MTCDRIAIINRGEIIATDSPENLVERLTGQGGYWVELLGQVDSSLSALRSVPGVVDAESVVTEGLSEGHWRYRVTTGAEDVGSAIAATVVSQGLELFELSRSRASLEDVFINLTMQDPTADAPSEFALAAPDIVPPDVTASDGADLPASPPNDEETRA